MVSTEVSSIAGQMQDGRVVHEDVEPSTRGLAIERGPVGLLRDVAVHVAGRVAELGGRLLAPLVEHVGSTTVAPSPTNRCAIAAPDPSRRR